MNKPTEKDIVLEGQLLHYYKALAVGEKKNNLIFIHGWG